MHPGAGSGQLEGNTEIAADEGAAHPAHDSSRSQAVRMMPSMSSGTGRVPLTFSVSRARASRSSPVLM